MTETTTFSSFTDVPPTGGAENDFSDLPFDSGFVEPGKTEAKPGPKKFQIDFALPGGGLEALVGRRLTETLDLGQPAQPLGLLHGARSLPTAATLPLY